MSGVYVYPRLPGNTALELAGSAPRLEPSTSHPKAAPYPTGRPVTAQVLNDVRQAVERAVAPWGVGAVPATEIAAWDAAAGDALYSSMSIVPADASSEDVWSFLTLVLMPDLALRRFPSAHLSRLLGRPRNVFRRVWWRRHLLDGLEIPAGARPLGEDELVGIFERSRMARNRPLVLAVARQILAFDGPDRSAFARSLTKRVSAATGSAVLDLLPPEELDQRVAALASEAPHK